MNKLKCITPILILFMIAVVVGVSGCTSTGSSAQQTYSDGSIKFNYTSGFQNATPPSKVNSGTNDWVDVAFLANSDNTAISIEKNNQLKDPSVGRADTDASINATSGVTMSNVTHTTETNPNGITIFKSTSTIKDSEGTVTYITFYFKDNKGAVYSIGVFNDPSNSQKVSDTANTIFNSLSLN